MFPFSLFSANKYINPNTTYISVRYLQTTFQITRMTICLGKHKRCPSNVVEWVVGENEITVCNFLWNGSVCKAITLMLEVT